MAEMEKRKLGNRVNNASCAITRSIAKLVGYFLNAENFISLSNIELSSTEVGGERTGCIRRENFVEIFNGSLPSIIH